MAKTPYMCKKRHASKTHDVGLYGAHVLGGISMRVFDTFCVKRSKSRSYDWSIPITIGPYRAVYEAGD